MSPRSARPPGVGAAAHHAGFAMSLDGLPPAHLRVLDGLPVFERYSSPAKPSSPRVTSDDELRVIEVTPHDYRRMAELLTTYSSLRLQAVDACVIALAERLDRHEIAALDRRDFQVVAPRHLPKGERLKLLPED